MSVENRDWIDDLVDYQLTASPAAHKQFGKHRAASAGLAIPPSCMPRIPQNRTVETDGSGQ